MNQAECYLRIFFGKLTYSYYSLLSLYFAEAALLHEQEELEDEHVGDENSLNASMEEELSYVVPFFFFFLIRYSLELSMLMRKISLKAN